MRQFPISANLIKTFLQCKSKFFMQYYDKKPRQKSNEFLAFGIAVHEALEKLWSFAVKNSEKLTKKDIENIHKAYYASAAKNGLEKLSLLEEGLEMVDSRIKSFDPGEKVLGLEVSFGLRRPRSRKIYTDNGTPISGAIDKITEINKSTLAVIDYKTSRTALTQGEANEDIQLSMYDYAISKLYPEYENIILVLDYLRLGEVTSYRTPEQRKIFGEFVDSIYEEIGDFVEESAKPEINQYCGWCDFADYCQSYKESITDTSRFVSEVGSMSDTDLVDEHFQLLYIKKLLDKREREINMSLMKKVQREGIVEGTDLSVGIRQGSRVNYDARDVFKIVPVKDFVNLVRVNKKAVDNYLNKNPSKCDDFSDIASVSFFSPSLKKRKNG